MKNKSKKSCTRPASPQARAWTVHVVGWDATLWIIIVFDKENYFYVFLTK